MMYLWKHSKAKHAKSRNQNKQNCSIQIKNMHNKTKHKKTHAHLWNILYMDTYDIFYNSWWNVSLDYYKILF